MKIRSFKIGSRAKPLLIAAPSFEGRGQGDGRHKFIKIKI